MEVIDWRDAEIEALREKVKELQRLLWVLSTEPIGFSRAIEPSKQRPFPPPPPGVCL